MTVAPQLSEEKALLRKTGGGGEREALHLRSPSSCLPLCSDLCRGPWVVKGSMKEWGRAVGSQAVSEKTTALGVSV